MGKDIDEDLIEATIRRIQAQAAPEPDAEPGDVLARAGVERRDLLGDVGPRHRAQRLGKLALVVVPGAPGEAVAYRFDPSRPESELARSRDEMKAMAVTDPLTKCYNRRLLYEIAEHELEQHRRRDVLGPVALAVARRRQSPRRSAQTRCRGRASHSKDRMRK